MSTHTTHDFVLSAAVSVDATSTGGARSPEPPVDMKFAGALTFSDDGILFVGDNHNGAIYAFEIPADQQPGRTSGRLRLASAWLRPVSKAAASRSTARSAVWQAPQAARR